VRAFTESGAVRAFTAEAGDNDCNITSIAMIGRTFDAKSLVRRMPRDF